MSDIELRYGDWREVLANVEADAVITDPPYSKRTHSGQPDNGGSDGFERRDLDYNALTNEDAEALVLSWVPRCRGWFVVLSDSDQSIVYRAAFERSGLTGFQPLPCVIRGMTVRLAGDGPSSWAIYANVGRPKSLCKWGTLPGAYTGGRGEREHIGGKPLWLMRAIIRDYTKPGDLVVDPCAGMATTLIAARMEGRRAVGAEVDRDTYEAAMRRINGLPAHKPGQAELFG